LFYDYEMHPAEAMARAFKLTYCGEEMKTPEEVMASLRTRFETKGQELFDHLIERSEYYGICSETEYWAVDRVRFKEPIMIEIAKNLAKKKGWDLILVKEQSTNTQWAIRLMPDHVVLEQDKNLKISLWHRILYRVQKWIGKI